MTRVNNNNRISFYNQCSYASTPQNMYDGISMLRYNRKSKFSGSIEYVYITMDVSILLSPFDVVTHVHFQDPLPQCPERS